MTHWRKGGGTEATSGNATLSGDSIGLLNALTEEREIDAVFSLLKSVKVTSSEKTYSDGSKFTNRIQTGGAISTSQCAIKFTISAAATLKIYANQSGGNAGDIRHVVLWNNEGQLLQTGPDLAKGTLPDPFEFSIPAAGTYYIGGGENGIDIYCIEVTETVADPLSTMAQGTSVKYDFNSDQAVFGQTTIAKGTEGLLSSDKYVQLDYAADAQQDITMNNGHGAIFKGKLTFTANVPAKSVGKFSFPYCNYGAAGTAKLYVGGTAQDTTIDLTKNKDKGCAENAELSYANSTDSTVKVQLVFDTTSTNYLHSLTYGVEAYAVETKKVAADIKYNGTTILSVTGDYETASSSNNSFVFNPTTYKFDEQPDNTKFTVEKNDSDELGGTYALSVSGKTISLLINDTVEATYTYSVKAKIEDAALDVSDAGNDLTTSGYWTLGNGWYTYTRAEKYVQANEVFAYYNTGSKVKMQSGGNFIQLDGSANKSGQAMIEINLPESDETKWDLLLKYSSKNNGTLSTVKYSIDGADLVTTGSETTEKDFSNPVEYMMTLDGAKKRYLIGAQGGMAILGLQVSPITDITVSGTVSLASGTTFPSEELKIYFTPQNDTSIKLEGTVNKSTGAYSVTIPASSITKKYDISFSDSSYLLSDNASVEINKNFTDVVDVTLTKVNAYTLSGAISGLGTDISKLTQLVFTPTSESQYEPNVTLNTTDGTYSVDLEIGTTYAVSAEGVNDYTVTNKEVTYADGTAHTLNIEFEKKAVYPITLNLGSTPDLSALNVNYVFTHEDGSVYTFTDKKAVSLRDGKYKVSITGDMDKVAYTIATGSSLTVNGATVTHVITFNPITSWDFTSTFTTTFQGNVDYYKGLKIDTTNNGKVRPNTNSAQLNSGTVISIPVTGPCKITVTAYQAGYALYTINGTAASTTEASTTVDYAGEAGYVNIVSTNDGAYIAGISIKYPATEVKFVSQTVMPYVPATDDAEIGTGNLDTDGIPKGNVADSITVQPVGQKLNITNAGGVATTKFADVNNLGYYVFPATADNNVLEFDVVVTANSGTGNDAGFFAGIFTNDYMSTLGLRAGGTKIRGVYTKNVGASGNTFTAGEFAGAGSPAEEVVGLNRQIHYSISLAAGKPSVTMTFTDDNGEKQTRSFSQGLPSAGDTSKVYFGIMVSKVSATITNMVYKNANGTIFYDQNACYYPLGSAPAVTTGSVAATAAESREYIDVTWAGDVPEGDGTYVVEVKLDNGDWKELSQDVTGFSYRYTLPEGEGGNYLFRVCGQLGKETLGGTRNDYVTMTDPVYVLAALARPVVTISADSDSISLDWDDTKNADYYLVYRYSFDEGAENARQIAKVTTSEYVDRDVEKEMPYYYQVKAESSNNQSPMSVVVWAVATAGHTGDYVYEDEATEIFLTKKSYDTVYTSEVTLEGVVLGNGTLQLMVNGNETKSVVLGANDEFSFVFDVAEGRNDVNLLFTDTNGKVTRKTFNYVYLTNYDMVVDAAYTGTDGESVDGVPTYKTVQAAVDSVSASNTDNKVILVKAGSYEERLVVDKPYVSLIGEDMEMTSIHCYPGSLGSAYEAGGDMDKRCATYIKSAAKGFSAENIAFANDYVYSTPDGKSNKSADAIRVEADNSAFVNVKFMGVQDTLYMHEGKQYYHKCTIEGVVDFIYSGDKARSFFNDCRIIFRYESTKTSGYVCAPKTEASATYGLTFYNCVITGEEGCNGNGYLLARPWGADAYITWIDCYMGKSVFKTLPYSDMSGNPYKNARFYEFGTYGPAFEINGDRRQISPSMAEKMITTDYLGWDPSAVSSALSSNHYVGSVNTNSEKKYVIKDFVSDKYLWTDGDDTGLKLYDQEGYASAYGVSGGGLLKESSKNYYAVKNATEFLEALVAIKASGKNSVIELQADINLGSREVAGYGNYGSVIKEYTAQALTHPTLIETGVSVLSLSDFHNLTIFSSNGSSIKHANITMKNSGNIIIRNIKFDELWEWDEVTNGDYDRNDWDYMTIDSGCDGIWIDHCTFFKAYDGVVDIKNPAPTDNVTISWCEFLPGSEDNIFFNKMMDTMAANPSEYPYYQSLKDRGMTESQIWWYAYGQKKTHLLGQDDTATNAAGIRLTMANNYYKDSMDRMPRLRYGYSHVYNCIMDSQELLDAKNTITDETAAAHIVSNGAASTCGAQVLLENCYISGIENALNSGNGSSPAGYINAINSAYYMNGVATKLEPKSNTTADTRVLITDADAFKSALPYDSDSYYLYEAEDLSQILMSRVGAGKLVLTNLQWEKASYNAEYVAPAVNKVVKAEVSEVPADVMTEEIKKATGCETVEELIILLKTLITEGAEAGEILKGIEVENTSAVDVAVMISFDNGNSWTPVTPENFPAEGLDVLIPYPENTNGSDYDFVIGHLNTMGVNGTKVGEMEYFNPTKTSDGLKIHIKSASPFVIGWKQIEQLAVSSDDDDDSDGGSSIDTNVPAEGTTAPTEGESQTPDATSPAEESAAVDTSDVNAGYMTFPLMALLMSGLTMAYVLFDRKRKLTK